jgi:hypothetical protein
VDRGLPGLVHRVVVLMGRGRGRSCGQKASERVAGDSGGLLAMIVGSPLRGLVAGG